MKIVKFLGNSHSKIVTTVVLISLMACATVLANDCERMLKPVQFNELYGDYIEANGVAITGEFHYPLETVLSNLELGSSDIAKLDGKSVLSVAEGISGFIPFLLSKDIQARGLDIWYGQDDFPDNFSGKLMRKYVADYSEHLIQGSAQSIPALDISYDLVVSHLLVNNFKSAEWSMIVDFITEAVRVTKPGGQIRIFGFASSQIENLHTLLDRIGPTFLNYKFTRKDFTTTNHGMTRTHSSLLLIINKS